MYNIQVEIKKFRTLGKGKLLNWRHWQAGREVN